MFILQPVETFKAPVKVNVATQSGAWREESFTAIFLRTDESERKELLDLSNVDLMRRVLKGWEMVDEHRQTVEFNEQNFEAFLRLTGACREAATTYWRYNVGAKEKN